MARRIIGFAAAGLAGLVTMWVLTADAARLAAPELDPATKYPRFESLRSDKVNLRTGPGDQYPIEWVLTRRGMPVEILATVDHWRKVRDWEGTLGWVHEKMVNSRRDAIVTGGLRALRQSPAQNAPIVARAESGVIGKLVECQGPWCRIDAGEYSGWLLRGEFFGVYRDEAVP